MGVHQILLSVELLIVRMWLTPDLGITAITRGGVAGYRALCF